MRRCLELAGQARANGETAVGAVVVHDGVIVGEGRERNRRALDPTAHAEVEAIRDACRRLDSLSLDGCELYTTVEPCILCSYAVRQTGIARVVYGVTAGPVGGGSAAPHPVLVTEAVDTWAAPPEVVSGFMAAECRALLG
jgi:tRNA(adenine34) deaminase